MLKDELAFSDDTTDLNQLILLSIRIDNRLWERRCETSCAPVKLTHQNLPCAHVTLLRAIRYQTRDQRRRTHAAGTQRVDRRGARTSTHGGGLFLLWPVRSLHFGMSYTSGERPCPPVTGELRTGRASTPSPSTFHP